MFNVKIILIKRGEVLNEKFGFKFIYPFDKVIIPILEFVIKILKIDYYVCSFYTQNVSQRILDKENDFGIELNRVKLWKEGKLK